MRAGLLLIATCYSAWLAGCGYVGDPLPPALNIPVPPSSLRVQQKADKLVVEFEVSGLTTEQTLLRRLGKLDVRIGPGETQPADLSRWEAQAQPVETQWTGTPGKVYLEIPAGRWVNQRIVVGARVASPQGRWSEWVTTGPLVVVPPLERPQQLTATVVAGGIQLTWACAASSPVGYRVFRRQLPGDKWLQQVTTNECGWLDAEVEHGVSYAYRIQAVSTVPGSAAESEPSVEIETTMIDRFPPATPTGVRAVATPAAVELSWDANFEKDLACYRVYRSEDGRDWKPVAECIGTPAYQDRQIETQREYLYAITAVDLRGNESARSEAIRVATLADSQASAPSHEEKAPR